MAKQQGARGRKPLQPATQTTSRLTLDTASWALCALAAAMSAPSFVAWAAVRPVWAQHRPCVLEGALALPPAALGLLRALLPRSAHPQAEGVSPRSPL